MKNNKSILMIINLLIKPSDKNYNVFRINVPIIEKELFLD